MCVTYYETYMSEGGGEGSNIFISCFVRRAAAAGSHPSRGAYICTYDSGSKVGMLTEMHD